MRTLARALIRPVQSLVPAAYSGVLVLAYHLVGGETSSAVDIPLDAFERQMEELEGRGCAIPLGLAIDQLQQGSVPSTGAVVVTFDDAYANFQTRAWPVLERLKIPVTLFVPTGFIDGLIEPPIRGTDALRPLSWAQLAELAASPLVEIGSHTRTHRNLPKLDRSSIWEELVGSKADIEERLKRPVTSFCYPRGMVSPEVEELAGQVYRCAMGAGGSAVRARRFRRTHVSRLPIRRDMPEDPRRFLASGVWLEEFLASRVRRWRA